MKKNYVFLLLLILFSLFSCTENSRARYYGGTAEIDLPQGKKLVNVTWKDQDLWYLMRDMQPGDKAETYTFVEKSSFGLFEGTYVIKEKK